MYIKVGTDILLAEKMRKGEEREKRFTLSIRGGMTFLCVLKSWL
jgi:6-phosphogluconolactonase/glucosamine-6-phosphate isomerase/deaminase